MVTLRAYLQRYRTPRIVTGDMCAHDVFQLDATKQKLIGLGVLLVKALPLQLVIVFFGMGVTSSVIQAAGVPAGGLSEFDLFTRQ